MTSTLSRRGFLGCACCAPLAASLTLGAGAFAPAHAAGKRTDLTADQALQLLKEGNRKFVADDPAQASAQDRNSRLDHNRRLEIARGQTPFAVLVSCSDSRVPPELLFGRGLGELFIVRNAGNTVDTTALGSIEYAVAELGVPLGLICAPYAAAREHLRTRQNGPDLSSIMAPSTNCEEGARSSARWHTVPKSDRRRFADGSSQMEI
jgi:carbonic anhydrase